MRQFRRPYAWDRTVPDIVIEPDGQVWVTITKPNPFTWNAYEKIEDLRAEDYDRPGSTRGRARTGSSSRSGRASNGYAGRSSGDDEGYKFDRERDPVADGVAVHELIEKWFSKQSKRDFPLSGGVV